MYVHKDMNESSSFLFLRLYAAHRAHICFVLSAVGNTSSFFVHNAPAPGHHVPLCAAIAAA